MLLSEVHLMIFYLSHIKAAFIIYVLGTKGLRKQLYKEMFDVI